MSAATGCMLGWYDANGYSGTNGLKDMEAVLGTKFAVTRVYNQWWPDHSSTITTATNDGRLVLSSHKPPKTGSGWVSVANGAHDSEITAMVAFYKGLAPHEVVFIFHHEPHDDASDLKGGTYGKAADFIRAYRRVGQAFRDAAATNVKLGYCAVANTWANKGSPVGTADPCYPGDDLVDVLCHDDYNWFRGLDVSKWDSMAEVMQDSVTIAKRLNKPIIFGEIGSQHGANGKERNTWFRDGAAWLKTGDAAKYVMGFCYYHVDNHNGSGNYWRFAQGAYTDGKQGYIDALAADSYFLTKPIPVSLQKVQPPTGTGGVDIPATQVASGGGIPSHIAFGMGTVSLAGGVTTISGAGGILSPADYQDPEESAGLDFGIATVQFGALPTYGGVFEPPVAYDLPAVLPETTGVARRLFRHYGPNPRGRSVVFMNGHYVTVDNPYAELLTGEEGVNWFLGGHRYVVDDDIAALLVGDGYQMNFVYTDWADLGSRTWADVSADTWQEF